MACASCRQTRCVCEDRGVLGISVTVDPPAGDDLIESTLDCPSTPCESTPGTPTECQNSFRTREGMNGDSFLFSAGGPFELGPIVPCPSTFVCPPADVDLVPLAAPTTSGFIEPGSLADVICVDLQPGTYKVEATFTMRCANPGTRVVVHYFPNCTDDTVGFTVLDCAAPCPPFQVAEVFLNQTTLQCTGMLAVPNPNCKAGFQILTQVNCAQCALEANAAGNTCVPSIENLQLIFTRLTARNLLSTNTTDLISNTTANVRTFNSDDASSVATPCSFGG